MEMILTGEIINAQAAYNIGLVNMVVPAADLEAKTMEIANRISEKSAVALRMAKEAVNQAFETSLAEGLALERKNFYFLFASEDQKEGMRAFLEKRKPVFRGN